MSCGPNLTLGVSLWTHTSGIVASQPWKAGGAWEIAAHCAVGIEGLAQVTRSKVMSGQVTEADARPPTIMCGYF